MVVREMVDVNDFHLPTNINAYFASGRPVLGVKITEGITYTSEPGMRVAKIINQSNGAGLYYHFATAATDGVSQARYFLDVVGPILRRQDIICLDIEGQPSNYQQWRPNQAAGVAAEFQRYIDQRVGPRHRRLVYSSAYFLDALPVHRGWRRWVASYGTMPHQWPRHAAAWQYTDRAVGIPGMPAGVDASHIRGILLPSIWHRMLPARKHPTLKPGSRGPAVRSLQQLLNAVAEAGLAVDGDFGKLTAAAVSRFKRHHHLSPDSVCGRRCWQALLRASHH